jgi:hypothetical protein
MLFHFSFPLTLESNTLRIMHGIPLLVLEWLVFSSTSCNRGRDQESLPACSPTTHLMDIHFTHFHLNTQW